MMKCFNLYVLIDTYGYCTHYNTLVCMYSKPTLPLSEKVEITCEYSDSYKRPTKKKSVTSVSEVLTLRKPAAFTKSYAQRIIFSQDRTILERNYIFVCVGSLNRVWAKISSVRLPSQIHLDLAARVSKDRSSSCCYSHPTR